MKVSLNLIFEIIFLSRILLVSNDFFGYPQNSHRFLNVDLRSNGVTSGDINNDFYVKYPFSNPKNDNEFFLFVFKILLPIAYQYNPEIVIVSLSFSGGKYI